MYYLVVILPLLVVVFNVLHRLIVVLVVVRTTLAVWSKRLELRFSTGLDMLIDDATGDFILGLLRFVLISITFF